MKKFSITLGGQTNEVNASEYSIAPKTNTFTVKLDGKDVFAATTSGKGKSAINNHYIYFREGEQLYYFKTSAEGVTQAKEMTIANIGAKPAEAAPQGEQTPAATPEAPKEKPKSRRRVAA